jgi:hypothetical protein
MVKNLIFILFIFIYINVVHSQSIENNIELEVSISEDTVHFNDSLKIILHYKNITKEKLYFYPIGIIGLQHYHPEAFITYSKSERIMYSLNDTCSYDEKQCVSSQKSFNDVYRIKIDSNFFYKGKNNICVFYHFKEHYFKRKKNNSNIIYGSLWSDPFQIVIK